ncbi:unnamed protein product [Dovyalis caffra]|uniref:Amino acid transporter transmembrane domain-containing protein n=1 Tax=Dovyalis caffra TaxID=77055 RepID=A0AAV1QQY0_9ROSI|nr:unnamed protein product [Dovyalis caffra]
MPANHALELTNGSCDDDGHPSSTGKEISMDQKLMELHCSYCYCCYRLRSSVLGLEYSTARMDSRDIVLALLCDRHLENGRFKGSITGAATTAKKVWIAFEPLGDIAFAYPYSIILLDIQDTLKSPPPENKAIKKVSMIAVIITTFFYLCCGWFGYAAFGNDTPRNLLTGFGFLEPFWLIVIANICAVLNLVGGYQVFSQPVFAFVERWFVAGLTGSIDGLGTPLESQWFALTLHHGATEILTVLEGRLLVGFATSNAENRLITKVPEKENVGHGTAASISSLSSQNPGVVIVSNALFGSTPSIPNDILDKASQVDKSS